MCLSFTRTAFPVALRKESVDRNIYYKVYKPSGALSLSARRAWIEMDASAAAAAP